MTPYRELGYANYLISKARARVRTQKRAVSQARLAKDPRLVDLGIELLALMEERLLCF